MMKRILVLMVLSLVYCLASAQSGWQSQNSGTSSQLYDVHFINHQKAWAVGSGGILVNTINGGETWSSQPTILDNLHSVHFADSIYGWAAGNGILKTKNGGASWTLISSVGGNDITFADSLKGWIVGSIGEFQNGFIRRTVDGGTTWETYDFGEPIGGLQSIKFITPQKGWAVGNEIIYKTADGGLTWEKQEFSGQIFNSVFFIDSLTGWIVGQMGDNMKTTDGGNTWVQGVAIDFYQLFSVWFSDHQNGWTVGDAGKIYKTSDGGTSWTIQLCGTNAMLNSAFFNNTQNGWIVGEVGTILHTSTGGITPTHKTLLSSPTFSLYPNPAEEWVNLKTEQPIRSVTVGDAMGRTVGADVRPQNIAALPNGNRLNISGLSPGLYTLKIQTAGGTAVQRVVKR